MDITLTGNPRAMTASAGAAETLPAAERLPIRETPQGASNLVVTSTPAPAEAGGVSPAEIEKSIVRDDALGKLVDKAFKGVTMEDMSGKVAKLISESQYETAKTTIDNMKPSEREIEMRKEHLKREVQKAVERHTKEVEAERLRAQLEAGLLPGEKGRVVEGLGRITVRA